MTLIEVLIAAAAFIIISFTLFEIVRHLAFSTQRLSTQQHQHADISHLLDQLESDQQSADAVFIPATDVFKNSNANAHEVDYFAKDGSNRPYYWAYYFDAAAHTVTRYNYASPGAAPIQSGSTIEDIQTFALSEHQISEVSDPSSPIYLPIFTSAANYNVPVGVGLGVQGGTHVIHLDIASKVDRIPLDLAAASAPSGFTVVLNYTPRPAPTPGKSLRTWPVAVAYGVNNTDVADANRMPQPLNVAMALNALLGGGTAQASGCHAIAFVDTAMRTPDTTAGPGGCYDGHIHAYEATGATATYQMPGTTCGPSVVAGAWAPVNATGAQADLSMASGSAITGCTLTFDDGTGSPKSAAHGLVTAAVFACSPVVIAPTGGAYCLWYGSVASGYIYQGGVYNTGRVWMYDDATNPGPNLDCSDYANSGSCAWNANGAVSYCFQGTSPPSAPGDIANAAGFTCADTGNPPSKPWPTIPCKATPAILCKGSGSGGPPRS